MASASTDHLELQRLKCDVSNPVGGTSRLCQSFLFAELSLLAYYDESVVRGIAQRKRFQSVQFLERDGAQAYVFETRHDCIVSCRGTEPTQWNDIQADLNVRTVVAETMGRVHRGFKREVDEIWPDIEKAIARVAVPIWFTGHSLGGAMATICAGRCDLSSISANPLALFTYGSPRVGNRRYINFVPITHCRWVNNNDVVTRLPPAWWGYQHSGREIYLDSEGHIRRLTRWQRFQDRLRGLLLGLNRLEIDFFSDHSILRYIEHISALLQTEQRTSDSAPPLLRPRRRTDRFTVRYVPRQNRAA